MKFSLRLLFSLVFLTLTAFSASAQVDSVVGQFTNISGANSGVMAVTDISGDGRFVVFESTADIASDRTYSEFRDPTTNQIVPVRNNADGNREIFLFDYAQRRIFQITNTKRALNDVNGSSTSNPNILVDVVNTRPVISNQPDASGRYWIAFASNAGVNVAGNNNPGNFDGNFCTSTPAPPATPACNGTNDPPTNRPVLTALKADGNLEIWMYQLPPVTPVDLSLGLDIPRINLGAGTYLRATDSAARFLPQPGRAQTTNPPVPEQAPTISIDNNFPSISDDGSVVAYVSDRNLPDNRNQAPNDNREIFVFRRGTNTVSQITETNFGSLQILINNDFPSISGDGSRVVFYSNANNPRTPSGAGENADGNAEVFYIDLNAPPTSFVQVTKTTRSSPVQTVNLLGAGRRISRDGRFIAFESISDAPLTNGGNQTTPEGGLSYALFVYDTTPPNSAPPRATQIGRRTFEDTGVVGGDFRREPAFTDYNANGTPSSIAFVSRINYRADGTIPGTASEGLNPDANRPTQIYVTPLAGSSAPTPTITLTRLSQISSLSDVRMFASNTRRRITFDFVNELGGGNPDGTYEGFYLLSSNVSSTPPALGLSFATGASALPVGSPQPTPTPTATPTPTGSPTPTPTPQTPSAVRALAPDMVAIANLPYTRPRNTVTASGASRTQRSFELPIELAGVTVSVNGAAAGIYSIDWRRQQVLFVIPKGLTSGSYTVTVNDNGLLSRRTLDLVSAQPDVFSKNALPSPLGRARVVNATNRVLQSEPFTVTTFRIRPPGRTATVFRVYLTGVQGAAAGNISIRVGPPTDPPRPAQILTGAVPTDVPGEYSIDFTLPSSFDGDGDLQIIVTVASNNSRLDDTAPRILIL